MNNIVFLVSGEGGNLRFIHSAIKLLQLNNKFQIVGVLADRECLALEYSKLHDIYNKLISYSKNNNEELIKELIYLKPNIIITNLHKIIDVNTLNLFKDKFINLHYSLLPSYGGVIGFKTLTLAKEDNVKFFGGTCHYVNENLDAGKIISQSCFPCNFDEESEEYIIELTFRSSALILLNGVLSLCGYNEIKTNEYNCLGKQIIFSPPLVFNINNFDNEFWKNIKLK